MGVRPWPDEVQDDELGCLTMWADGTVGFHEELQALRLLNKLCKAHGYGRIPQLARELEALWRDPDKAKEFEQSRADRFAFLDKAKADLEAMAKETD